MAERYEAVTLHLRPDQIAALDKHAGVSSRSRSWMARWALDEAKMRDKNVRAQSRSAPNRSGETT